MSKIEEFKEYVKKHPILINYVKEDKMTWQKFYEIYDLYGEDNEIWNEYLNTSKEVKEDKKVTSFNDILNLAKNMDVDKVQEGITSLQKAIALFGDLFTKNDSNSINSNTYTPRPVYRNFED